MLPLLRLSGFGEAVATGTPLLPFDLHVPILNLPGVFHTTFDNLPAAVPYLTADPRLVERWKEKLSSHTGFKVGIHWQGNRAYKNDQRRSIPLREFRPLADVPGTQWFSLQKNAGCEQLAEVADQYGVVDLGPELDVQSGAFTDTAAVMGQLGPRDHVRHGNLPPGGPSGRQRLGRTARGPGLCWFLDRDDSPWYPTMRLFRQTSPGDWPGVFERMTTRLREIAG